LNKENRELLKKFDEANGHQVTLNTVDTKSGISEAALKSILEKVFDQVSKLQI
jgi:hypothetical protein